MEWNPQAYIAISRNTAELTVVATKAYADKGLSEAIETFTHREMAKRNRSWVRRFLRLTPWTYKSTTAWLESQSDVFCTDTGWAWFRTKDSFNKFFSAGKSLNGILISGAPGPVYINQDMAKYLVFPRQ